MTPAQQKKQEKQEKNITDSVLTRFNNIRSLGEINVPKDYSPENALKAAWFELQSVKTKNDELAIKVCSQESIANSLFQMVTSGLNPMKKQCYFIAYGKELSFQRSYQGSIALAKRYSGVKSVKAKEIYENDEFITEILSDGREVLKTHKQPFENTDNKIIGGYCVIVDKEGKENLTKMSMKKIKTSWDMRKSKGLAKFHEQFDDEAVKRTLYNRACKPYINSSNDENIIDVSKHEKPLLTIEGQTINDDDELILSESKIIVEKPENIMPINEQLQTISNEEIDPGY